MVKITKPKVRTPTLNDCGGDMSKYWYVTYYLPRKSTGPNKLYRYRYYDGFSDWKTEKERRAYAYQLIKNLKELAEEGNYAPEKELPPDPEKIISLSQAFEKYRGSRNVDWSTSHLRAFTRVERSVKKWEEKRGGAKPLDKITGLDITELMERVRLDGDIEAKTWNDYLDIVSSVFNYFKRLEIIDKNPCTAIARLTVKKGNKNKPFTMAQVTKFKHRALELEDPQFHLFIDTMLYLMGRPRKEIQLLKISDITQKNVMVIKSSGKKGFRYIPMIPKLWKILVEYGITTCKPNWYLFGKNGRPGPEFRKDDYFYLKFIKYLEHFNLDKIGHNLYSFKPTGAIHALRNGVDIKTIQLIMGHASLKQTHDYFVGYGEIVPSDEELDKMPDY